MTEAVEMREYLVDKGFAFAGAAPSADPEMPVYGLIVRWV
jgi:hypothetical protein